MILSDLESLGKIFNDTKRRAVFLRQLSFLCCKPSETFGQTEAPQWVMVVPAEIILRIDQSETICAILIFKIRFIFGSFGGNHRSRANNKLAAMFADVCHQERLARIDSEVAEEEDRQRQEAVYKKQRIDVAEQRRNAPVDDSKMVDEMFGFVDQDQSDDAFGPSAFQVCHF